MPGSAGGDTCPNCGAPASGAYCSSCGQAAESPIQPLRAFVREALEDLFSLDGRLFRGLRDLVVRPGHLTREYLAGRRARHMHPIRLLLVAGAIAYAVSALVPTERSSVLLTFTGAILGEAGGWIGLLAALGWLLASVTVQRWVFFRSGRVFLEHLVLILHVAAFGMLLAPVETLALLLFPPTGMAADGVAFSLPVLLAIYWVVALHGVLVPEERIMWTTYKAVLTGFVAICLGIAGTFLWVSIVRLFVGSAGV